MKRAPRPNDYRDAWAGDLRGTDAGREARVAGWVHRRRDHGGLIFIDLRDRSGLVQLVFHPGAGFETAEQLRPEHVLSARGTVTERDDANKNPNLATGGSAAGAGWPASRRRSTPAAHPMPGTSWPAICWPSRS